MVGVCAAEDEIIRVNFEGGTTEKSYVPSSSRGRVIHLFSGQTHSETNALDNLNSTVLSFGFVNGPFSWGVHHPRGVHHYLEVFAWVLLFCLWSMKDLYYYLVCLRSRNSSLVVLIRNIKNQNVDPKACSASWAACKAD